jgi:hypothetical protein
LTGPTGATGPQGPAGIKGDNGSYVPGTSYSIGGTGPNGGIVFWIYGTGEHGLEAYPSDEEGVLDWQTSNSTVLLHGIGWRVPRRVELNMMYDLRGLFHSLTTYCYWSSTEVDANDAYYLNFRSLTQGSNPKIYPCSVRAIHDF